MALNDRLILRTITSPFGDLTKGVVLSHEELDNNQLFLKGQDILTATTITSGQTIVFTRFNSDTINVDISSLIPNVTDLVITGGTYDPNTGVITYVNSTGGTFDISGFTTGFTDTFVNDGFISGDTITLNNSTGGTIEITGLTGDQNNLVEGINVTLNTPFDGIRTVSEAVNLEPTFVIDEKTNLVVRTFQAPGRGGIKNYVSGYYLLKPGKGTYGVGGIVTTDADYEHIGTDTTIINNPNPTIFNPDAIVFDITGHTGTTIEDAVDNSPESYVLGVGDDVYFRLQFSGSLFVYRYLGELPITLGSGGTGTTADDYLEFYNEFNTSDGPWTAGTSNTGVSFSIKAINDSGLSAEGNYAVAQGFNTKASGDSSHAEGRLTSALSIASHSEGSQTTSSGAYAHSEGDRTIASGAASHSEGTQTSAVGLNSHAEGFQTIASGIHSHSQGNRTVALGDSSHAEGQLTTASGNSSHAEGILTTAIGNFSHAEGNTTTASGDNSHAEGRGTIASGDFGAHAEGFNTIASGSASHAEGDATLASGDFSHAEGEGTSATTLYSHAEGLNTLSNGAASHAEGNETTASGEAAHSEGVLTTASGNRSHAQNQSNVASGDNSHVGGFSSTADTLNGFVHSNSSILTSGATNSAIIGGVGITGISADTVYVPNLNIVNQPINDPSLRKILGRADNGEVKELDVVFSGTHAELSALTINNNLIVGNKYILTDYMTVYNIEGSDSSDIIQINEVIGSAGAYSQFSPGISSEVLANGDTVEVVELPVGYGGPLVTGDTLTVIDFFSEEFIRFSPVATTVGIKLKIQKQRYPNVGSNVTINDINGKPVLKQFGVLNTEVHDDGPYMSMTTSENPSPITERIVLTAIDTDKFSRDAESLTFVGDKLEYDFTNTTINDANGFVKTGVTRNGFILKRTNEELDISMNLDWRVRRFRRYQMDEDNWNNYTLRGTGSTLYEVAGINYCTYTNGSISTDHRFIMREPFSKAFYVDFTKKSPDPFTSGTTTAPAAAVFRLTSNIGEDITVDVTLPPSGFTGTTLAKDFHVIPISGGEPTSIVERCRIKNIENTIFLTNSQRFGESININVTVRGDLFKSSFMSGVKFDSIGGCIEKMTTLDRLVFQNSNTSQDEGVITIENLHILSYASLTNSGVIRNIMMGGRTNDPANNFTKLTIDTNSVYFNSIFGGRRQDGLTFDNVQASHILTIFGQVSICDFSGRMYLTKLNTSVGSTYTTGSKIKLVTFTDQIPGKGEFGYVYDVGVLDNDIEVDNLNTNKDILYRSIDANNNITLITIANPS